MEYEVNLQKSTCSKLQVEEKQTNLKLNYLNYNTCNTIKYIIQKPVTTNYYDEYFRVKLIFFFFFLATILIQEDFVLREILRKKKYVKDDNSIITCLKKC